MPLGTLYPLADRYPGQLDDDVEVRAQLTGEKRPPKAGEWYLSGAIPEAYRAPNDLTTDHMICVVLKVRRRVTWEILDV